MNHVAKILFFLLICNFTNLQGQTIVTSTVDHRTVEYSYDSLGRLVKNFSIYKKVNIDSLQEGVYGKWRVSEYISWEKETIDSLPITLKFEKDSVTLIEGVLFSNIDSLNGSFEIQPNNAEGAEILLKNLKTQPRTYEKIFLYVIHYQEDIMYISVMTHTPYSKGYRGLYKLVRTE